MAGDLYEQLAVHLDSLPAGYPRTQTGVELLILRRLFTPEDAQLALHLTLIPEEARVIARRAGLPVDETSRRLEEMEQKRLVFGIRPLGKPPQYQAMQFLVGLWEGQINQLDRDFVQEFEEYLPSYFNLDLWEKAPQMRTVPVGASVSAKSEVMPYEQAEALVRAAQVFSVSNCVCRQEMRTIDQGCSKPLETCLGFGIAAEHIARTGRGRAIDLQETLDILHQADEAGLVLQPANAKEPLFLCACCGCCCSILRSVKRSVRPAELIASPFVAVLDVDVCDGCGLCEARCQMEAIQVDNGRATLDLSRCIGCGLCVTTCPTAALSLERKPEPEPAPVPKDIVGNYLQMGKNRGRLGMKELLGMQLKSKLDRLLAPRD